MSLGLAGFAATAFGIAPQVPDAADLPQRTVVENIATVDLHAQLDALAEHDLELYRSDVTRVSDTADSLLARLNVADPRAAAFLRSDPMARKLLDGRAGKRVQVRVDSRGALEELVARYAAPGTDKVPTHFTRLRIQRIADKLVADTSTVPLTSQARDGQRHDPLLALRRDRRSRHSRRGRDAARRDLRQRHRLPARAEARRDASRSSTRR